MTSRVLRAVTGVLVLAGAGAVAVALGPVYGRAYRFQSYTREVGQALAAGRSEEWARVALVNRAAELGLPVRSDGIRCQRQGEWVKLEVRYAVPVRLGWYTVDLHFRARASSNGPS